MKKIVVHAFLLAGIAGVTGFLYGRETAPQPGYFIEHEKDLATGQPGPHDGGGQTTAYNFFGSVKESNLAFRKRVLHPGSSIGYHLQKHNEIYYILSGNGELTMNGKKIPVTGGDAILTLPGNSHGLKQTGREDLVVIINYITD